jgi:Zn-dependent protease with chaperone function
VRPALLVFGYALAVAWLTPALLLRLTAGGVSPRLGIAGWSAAMLSALASSLIALQFLARAAVSGWSGLAAAVCRSVAGGSCAPAVYRSAAFETALGLVTIAAVLAVAVLSWRYGRSVQQAQRRTRAHAEAARITGRRMPGPRPPVVDDHVVHDPVVHDPVVHDPVVHDPVVDDPVVDHTVGDDTVGDDTVGDDTVGDDTVIHDTVVLDAAQRAAYCVPGRPATIVLTSAALAVLGPAQLGAVLAHERAHLAGRHHLLITPTRALAACLPGVPLFTRGPAEVARLAEMRADDAAARHSGRPALIGALLAMGTGTAVPAGALAATACAVSARVLRLLEPPHRARRACNRLALATAVLLLVLAPGIAATAGPLAARGLLG